MKQMETNNEPSLLPAMLAFGSEKTSPYSFASNLAEGLVIAKKGLSKKRFLKEHLQGCLESSFENDLSSTISVLLGTQDAIHKWLRMSGHARCALWIEHSFSENVHEKKYYSYAKLELVYRKRDYQVCHVEVLQECKLILSLAKQSKLKQSGIKEFSKDYCEYEWNGLQQHEINQMDCGNERNGLDCKKGTTTLRWYILMKVPAFKKLKNMLSLGGALWEFRRLLLQVISLPEFVDINFQSINLQERLTHHPYAIFLNGCDAIMMRTTLKGVFVWKIVRFDFNQGIVTLAGGETLKEFMCCVQNNVAQKISTQNFEDHQQITCDKITHQNSTEYGNFKCCTLDWAVWRGVYRAGPMETILTSAFASEDDCMVLKSLTTFFSTWKDMELCRCCVSCDLGTAFRECRSVGNQSLAWKLSSKEQCAISHLRNVKQEVCWQGLRILLKLLLDEVRDLKLCGFQRTTPNTAKKSTRSTPLTSRSSCDMEKLLHSQQLVNSKKNSYIEEKENMSLLSKLMAVMDRPLKRPNSETKIKLFGSETQRALQAAEIKWKCFEEMKSDRSSSTAEKTYNKICPTLKWQQVLEWVDNGFLEVLLKESTNSMLEDGKYGYISMENVADACLQVVNFLPNEGSYRIATCLVSKLVKLIEVFESLEIPQNTRPLNESLTQQKIEKLKKSFEEMLCSCRLIVLLINSSVAIASSLANMDGLFLILSLYSIILKEFPMNMNNVDVSKYERFDETLPGEIFGLERNPSKINPHASSNVKAPCLQRKEENRSKGRLALQEVLSKNYFKVLNVSLDTNIPFTSLEKNSSHISKNEFLMSTCRDTEFKSHICPQILTSIVDVIWETKLQLLQSLVILFESHSLNLNKCKAKMKEKLSTNATSLELLFWLLSDLIGAHSNAHLLYISHKLNKLIFKIIFLLEKGLEESFLHIQCPQENQFTLQIAKEEPWQSGLGPPPILTPKVRLLGLMLVELKERMDHILNYLMITLPGHVVQDDEKLTKYKKMTKNNATTYIFFLWSNLSYLLMVLSDYISYWPTKEPKSQNVLQCCGGQLYQTLNLLANLGPIASWAPAHILTMQSLLKLLSLCLEDSIATNAKETWSECEKFLWEMLIETWAHWNCIQSYVNWMILEVCQSCLISHINDFQKDLFQPIYLYYLALEEQLGIRGTFKDPFENFQNLELMPIKAITFLHLVVLLAQQKVYTHDNNLQVESSYLHFCNNALWFLHQIMNPIYGLIMMVIKNKPLKTCLDCKIEIVNPKIISEISFCVEKYSLLLLAQIFGFKFFPSNTHIQKTYRKNCTNVYLCKKYLHPFICTLYSSFKSLYPRLTQQTRLNSLCTLQEAHSWEVENKCPLTNQSSLESIVHNDKNVCLAIDEILNPCYLRVQVLHAIAKNFSKDGNQIFKDLYVMNFLIQEISLEYEFSRIVDSKSNSKDEMATNSIYSSIQKHSSRNNLDKLNIVEGSNSSTNSNKTYCMLSSIAQEYDTKKSILICQDSKSQRVSKKCSESDEMSLASLKQSNVDLMTDNKVTNYSRQFKTRLNIESKDINLNDDCSTINQLPIQLSCNPIIGTVKFGSKVDKNDLKSLRGIGYSKKEVVYSGRFFDLNEEVDRELAIEEENELSERRKQVSSIEENGFINIEREVQTKNIKELSLSPTSTRSTSCDSTNKDLLSTLNNRPCIPKLNFTSALQTTQSNLASNSDSEIVHSEHEGQFGSNEDVNIECKSSLVSMSYENERSKRSIYHNSNLHVLLLELIICLMLDPQGALEVCYCDRFPMEHQKINAPFYLFYHINHARNEHIIPILAKCLDTFHPSAYRILKLTWQALFDPSLYTNRTRIAQGALSQVVALPKGPLEPCSFFDVYSEVQILERFRGDARVCQILDYGVDRDAFVLVLQHYKCSLRAWRHRHSQRTSLAPLRDRLPLYLHVYAAVLQAVKALEAQNVVHYDLKCDNVLLEPLSSTLSDEDFWQPKWPSLDKACAIPFSVSITDFGQSKASIVEGGECTARNRGTECVKSPEMLKLLSSSGNVDARRASTSSLDEETSVGNACDVWGLGCLLYELLTGEYLLYDDDWVRFFMRVTLATEELIPDEKAAKLDNHALVIDFLRFILVRDPTRRPSLADLLVHLEQLQATLRSDSTQQPRYEDDSTASDIFDELASDSEDDDPQILLPATVRPLQHHADVYKRCQTLNKAQLRHSQPGIALRAKRQPRFWQRCCPCCWRNVDVMR